MSHHVRPRGQRWELRVKHKLLPESFYATFSTEAEGGSYGQPLDASVERGVCTLERALMSCWRQYGRWSTKRLTNTCPAPESALRQPQRHEPVPRIKLLARRRARRRASRSRHHPRPAHRSNAPAWRHQPASHPVCVQAVRQRYRCDRHTRYSASSHDLGLALVAVAPTPSSCPALACVVSTCPPKVKWTRSSSLTRPDSR